MLSAAAFSLVRLEAQSPHAVAQRMMPFALNALSAGGPTGILDSLYGASCDLDEGGGSASGGGAIPARSGSSKAAISPAISLNKDVLSELIPAGDLDGVAGADVLDYRLTANHHAIDAGVTARSGVTGAELWTRELPGAKDQFTFPFVEPDLVGTTSAPGALLVSDIEPLFQLGTNPASLTVEAIDGAGDQSWTQTLTGQITTTTTTSTLTDVPIVIGDVENTATGGHDLLVDVLNATYSDTGENGSDQPEIISAATGAVTTVGAPIASKSGIPEVVPVPDLSGDGVADIAAIVPGKDGSIVAERSDNGAQIWSSTDVAVGEDAALTPVGKISSPDTPDLVLGNEPSPTSDRSTATLIDGTTGAAQWTHKAVCAYEIDRAGPTLQPAVGLVTDLNSRSSDLGVAVNVVVSPRSRDGKVVYRRSISDNIKARKPVHRASYDVQLHPLGDVQADGSQDLIVAMKASAGHDRKQVSGVISGKTGRLIETPAGAPSDGSLRSGEAVDVIDTIATASGVTVSAYRGATGTRYYARHVADTKGLKPGPTYGIRISGHDCSDLAIAAQGPAGTLDGLYSAAGDPIWTVASTAKQLTGGTVQASTSPTTYCLS